MALYVDYWNYLGWRERFSKVEYSQRQYARGQRMNTVYTPEYFVDGQESRRRRRSYTLIPQYRIRLWRGCLF